MSVVRRLWRELTFRARVLLVVGGLFLALVALRLHGSSIALGSDVWAPHEAMDHFVASPLLSKLSPRARERWRSWLMAEPREIRVDEWAHEGTPYALAQFSHVPRFPVVNTNVGNGQNMLVLAWTPVLHPSALARPATWGYLLLGPEHGLAWFWWFQALACFVALYLLFELIIPHRPWLSLLGATWFCGSSYVVCWSLWAAYVTGLGVLSLLGAYWMLKSARPVRIVASGALVGVSFSAFCMQLYPPWQVPLGHTFLLVFAALAWRDRLLQSARTLGRFRLLGLALAVVLTLGLLGSFLVSSRDALHAMAQSEYPGTRRSFGGDCPSWRLFGGLLNAFTNDYFSRNPLLNPSEASGFFLLFPAVMVAAAVSPRIRSRLGPVVWLLLPWAAFLVYFCLTPIPKWLASSTLLAHAPGYRAQIALGLSSVILCLRLLAAASLPALDREAVRAGLSVFVACAALYSWQCISWEEHLHYFKQGKLPLAIVAVCLVAAVSSACLALGRARWFAALLVPGLILTSANFNPLSVGFPEWRSSELFTAIQRVVAQDYTAGEERQPFWLTYGRGNFGVATLHLMGARGIGGTYYYPQLDLWRRLDKDGRERFKYNRFAVARFELLPFESQRIEFKNRAPNMLGIYASPLNPKLWDMGVRHVLTLGDSGPIKAPPFELVYRSIEGDFAIWDLPSPRAR